MTSPPNPDLSYYAATNGAYASTNVTGATWSWYLIDPIRAAWLAYYAGWWR